MEPHGNQARILLCAGMAQHLALSGALLTRLSKAVPFSGARWPMRAFCRPCSGPTLSEYHFFLPDRQSGRPWKPLCGRLPAAGGKVRILPRTALAGTSGRDRISRLPPLRLPDRPGLSGRAQEPCGPKRLSHHRRDPLPVLCALRPILRPACLGRDHGAGLHRGHLHGRGRGGAGGIGRPGRGAFVPRCRRWPSCPWACGAEILRPGTRAVSCRAILQDRLSGPGADQPVFQDGSFAPAARLSAAAAERRGAWRGLPGSGRES
jgi:hypothetical protein